MIDEIIDLPVPHRMNQEIINYLGKQKWMYVNDSDKQYQNLFSEIIGNLEIKDAGQAIVSYKKNGEFEKNDKLNFFAYFIFCLIQERSKFNLKEPTRIYWNLYSPNSVCQPHSDDQNLNKFVSAVYSLHTNDGGTLVENQFYKSKEGQALIFKSEKIHKGIASKTTNLRLNLNLVMEI